MSWIGKDRRWMKMHRRRRYVVSCRQLGCEPTKEASWRLANEWWKRKLASLTPPAPKHPFQALLDQLRQKEAWARQHGQVEEAAQLAKRLSEVEKQAVPDRTTGGRPRRLHGQPR